MMHLHQEATAWARTAEALAQHRRERSEWPLMSATTALGTLVLIT